MNSLDIDFRRLNLIRNAILKEFQNDQIIPLDSFMNISLGILKIPNFENSETMEAIKQCITEDTF